jgi:predicted N-acyltransferase
MRASGRAAGADAFAARRVERIAEIDPRVWNALAANDVYAQHGWLRVLESTASEGDSPAYLLLYRGTELVAAAVCYRLDAGEPDSSLDGQLFGRISGKLGALGVSLRPALLCGPLIGQGRHVLWRRAMPPKEVDRALSRLLDEIFALAAKERRTLAFGKVPADEQVLISALEDRGLARTMNWPVSYIDILWDDFDTYLAHLTGKGGSMATKARREVAAPAKVGVEIRRAMPFRDAAGEIFALIESNQYAHSREPLGLAPNFMHELAERCAAAAVVTTARASGELTGAALLLRAGDCAGGPLIGVTEDERNRKAFAYFNLALYAPIRFCIEHGIGRLYLGAGLYEMKQRRGCRELELLLFVRPASKLGRVVCRLWCAFHRRWAIAKLRRQGVYLARFETKP